jgi:hypothetical protein
VLVRRPFDPKLLCPICGEKPVEHDGKKYIKVEHIPPRGLFVIREDRNGLITVPSCLACNAGTALLDQEFQVYLSIHLGTGNSYTNALWNNALKTSRKNQRLKRSVDKSISPTLVRTNAGYQHPVAIPADLVSRSMNKIVRGLHWWVTDEVLPKTVLVKGVYVQSGQQVPIEVADTLREFGKSVARCNNQFEAVYAIVEDRPFSSLWLICFYGQEYYWAVLENTG